ncbi:MAG: hypothetical protein ACE141_15635 [Bryobacteraceae bacterium]
MNELHYSNESLNLKDIPKQPPLKVLGAVLRILTLSGRLQAGRGD